MRPPVGDAIRIADAARLFRSVADILALRPVLIRRGLHLRVESDCCRASTWPVTTPAPR